MNINRFSLGGTYDMLIGLTGGIASGKSTISQFISEMGIPIIDADVVAREVVEPGTKALKEIENYFGPTVIQEDGTLARKALGAIIFKDPAKREVLNKITHPAVRERMEELKQFYLKSGAETIVYDIPLLYESNLFHLVDKVLLVYVDKETQLKRLLERDQTGLEDAKQRIASQMPLDDKRKRADAIIDNTKTKEHSKKQLEEIFEQWLAKTPQ